MSDDKQKNPPSQFKGRGAVLAHGRPFDRQPLRRPGQGSGTKENSVTAATASGTPAASTITSTLSPLAAEFVPNAASSSYVSGDAAHHHPHFASSTASSGASGTSGVPSASAYPSVAAQSGDGGGSGNGCRQPPTQSQPHQQPPSTTAGAAPVQHHEYENGGCGGESESEIAVEHLRTIIYEITVNPGKFDMLASMLVDTIGVMLDDEATLYAIVDQIFEQAVCEANFRYNGARLCNHFSKNLKLSFPTSGFRVILFQRCQQEFVVKDDLAIHNVQRLRDFTMFMGELFIHLEILFEGRLHKVALLAKTVPQLLTTLLRNPLKDNVKCVCQMLKFTGAALEDYERFTNEDLCPFMEDLFMMMKDLCAQDLVDRNCRELLIKVIELRAVDWGRQPVHQEPVPVVENHGTGPVMYGPDGLPLSKEEAFFLESNADYYDTNGTEEDGSEADYYGNTQSSWSTSDGMDDEMVAAFEKFLLETS